LSSDVTIIIPCYGHAKYLLETVDSCLKQVTLPEKILILLMDLESQAMFHNLTELSPIISCIVSDKLIPAVARNLLFSLSNTKYIIPLDADDILPPHYILRVLQVDADIVYTDYRTFPNGGKTKILDVEKSMFLERHPQIVVTTLIKKSAWEKIGGYNEEFIYGHENWEFMYRAFILGLNFKKCNNTFLRYRQNEVSAGKNAIKNFQLIFNQMQELYPEDFKSNNKPKERINYVK